MASRNALKANMGKADLLQWLNSSIKQHSPGFNKIESLGNGVGYLLLLNHLYPSSVALQKINKKPLNEYDYQSNLKMLANCFAKLHIDKPVDIQKLSKMKLQDNLEFLQWFHKHSLQNSRYLKQEDRAKGGKGEKGVKEGKGEKVEKEETVGNKKPKIKVPQKIGLHLIEKSSKTDIEETGDELDLKWIGSPSRKINRINQIINNQPGEDKSKLSKIIEILQIKSQPIHQLPHQQVQAKSELYGQTPIKHLTETFSTNKMMGGTRIEQRKEAQTKQMGYVQCNKLESKYDQLLKKSMMKNSTLLQTEQQPKNKQVCLRILPECQNFDEREERCEGRLTDTSNLLQSDRKSVQSETYLLPDI